MPDASRGIFARQGKGSHIRHDQRIHTDVVQKLQMGRQPGDLVIAGHSVDGTVHLHTPLMGIGHRLAKFILVKVSGKSPHAEAGPCQIHGISTVGHRHLQPLHIPGRSKQLRPFSYLSFLHSHCS